MTNITKLRKGLDIPLEGVAEKKISAYNTGHYAVKPTDFRGIFPKLLVKEGDLVKAGTPLFFDKYQEQVMVVAPVSGKVTDIKRGKKRVIEEIRIDADETIVYESFSRIDPQQTDGDTLLAHLLKTGAFALLRQRPYAVVASPADKPKAIFISGFDTAPLAPDMDLLVEGEAEAFQTGLHALGKLTEGKVYLNLHPSRSKSQVLLNAKGVEIHYFEGPHPAGSVGVQIHHLSPVNKGEVVWYLSPQDVILMGRVLLHGKFDATTLVALAGSEAKQRSYFRTIRGCSIDNMIKDNTLSTNIRYISGNILTGEQIDRNGYVGFFDHLVTLIPEGNYHEFFGWALPGIGKFSVSRTFFSWLQPKRKYRLDTNTHGGRRAYVMSGEYENVLPMDIYPVHLIKAILVEDIDLMENLGIYEVAEEDMALCEYVCTSKMPVQQILRQGLDMIRKEMS